MELNNYWFILVGLASTMVIFFFAYLGVAKLAEWILFDTP